MQAGAEMWPGQPVAMGPADGAPGPLSILSRAQIGVNPYYVNKYQTLPDFVNYFVI
jgi:hypothetical protein